MWARFLRRQQLQGAAAAMGAELPPLGPPTDEEKHDAIKILRDSPEWIEAMDETMFPENAATMKHLIAEAERIWLEASE